MYIHIKSVSINTATKKITFDRPTIRGKSQLHHTAYLLGSALVSGLLAMAIQRLAR